MTHMMLHRPVIHHHVRTQLAGQHALRLSVLSLFVGVPAAAMAWRIWSLVLVGPSAAVEPQRFEAWGRVFVQLPATVLVVAVAVAAVVLAAKAGAARIKHADEVLGLGSVGLLVVLFVVATTVLNTVQTAPSTMTTWAVRAAAPAVTGLVGAAAYLWARDVRR